MAEVTYECTEDLLSLNDLVNFPWSSDEIDGINFDTIKLTAETDLEQLLTMVDEQVGVDRPASEQVNQLPITSQVEQPVEGTYTQLTEPLQVSLQVVEQPPSPQTIDNAVSSQFIQPVSPEFVSQPLSIVFVDQTALSQDEDSATKYLVTTTEPMSVTNGDNTECVLDEIKPKKRGRKPKSSTGPMRRPRRQPKPKVYEMLPFNDAETERKRLNAVNAKRHRDLAKQKMATLECQLNEVTMERDNLKQMVEKLQQNEKMLLQKLGQQQQPAIFTLEQMLE